MDLAEDGLSVRHFYTIIAAYRRAGGICIGCCLAGGVFAAVGADGNAAPSPHRRDIAKRPEAANPRSESGHGEVDLVEGKGRHSYLLTLQERKSRLGLITRGPHKVIATLRAALVSLLNPFARSYRCWTLDKGGEFAGHIQVAQPLGRLYSVFFARPYCLCDKESVEEFNGRIRRDFLKGTEFHLISPTQIESSQTRINLPPLRFLAGQSPLCFLDQLLALPACQTEVSTPV